ncbi:HAD family phosphatase [Allomuricauda sp. d1]|uniref:HAD family hydrolase n=1 Tax=Allomuricauda sp. d1 TaxID=3136725 RepID=UPI0031D29E78
MIKNIIFDFGDIFIDLDKPATGRAMAPFGFTEITPELDSLFKAYEKGIVSSDDFLETTGNLFPKANKQQLIDAWNAILLDFPLHRLTFLEQLAEEGNYRLFLLSNTNEIHIQHEKEKMGEHFMRFKNCFEQFYLSYEMGMRKPDAEIFEFVLQQNGLSVNETLFIDDTLENIESASTLGIRTWHLQVGSEDITELNHRL